MLASSSSLSSTAVLHLLAVLYLVQSTTVFVFSQQSNIDELIDNVTSSTTIINEDEDRTLFTNYDALRKDGQGFFLLQSKAIYETPESNVIPFTILDWVCDLEFLEDDDGSNQIGYVGRVLRFILESTLEDINSQGGQIPTVKQWTASISAIMVPTLGIFEGQIHASHDDYVFRYWDDGLNSTLPVMGWEGHDEGDMHPNSNSAAWSTAGQYTLVTVAEAKKAAEYFGLNEEDLNPEQCSKMYKAAWDEKFNKPDPINATITAQAEEIAKLQADVKELMARVTSNEESVATATNGGTGGDAKSTSSPYTMTKWMLLVAVITGFLFIDFSY